MCNSWSPQPLQLYESFTTKKQSFYIGYFHLSTSVMMLHRSRRCWKSRVLQRRLFDRCRIPHVRRRVSCKTRHRIMNILHRLLAPNRRKMLIFLNHSISVVLITDVECHTFYIACCQNHSSILNHSTSVVLINDVEWRTFYIVCGLNRRRSLYHSTSICANNRCWMAYFLHRLCHQPM